MIKIDGATATMIGSVEKLATEFGTSIIAMREFLPDNVLTEIFAAVMQVDTKSMDKTRIDFRRSQNGQPN
jgi:hypothetical protein